MEGVIQDVAAGSHAMLSSRCTFPVLAVGVGEWCTAPWALLQPHLRPTQAAVGFAWVHHKATKFDSNKHAQKEMDDTPVPVAKGPDGLFLLDHHHELSALDYAGYPDTEVTVFVSCDFSALSASDVWAALVSRAFAYPYGRPLHDHQSLPHLLNESALPTTIGFSASASTFRDDPWRSLASFVRKVKELDDGSDCPKHASSDCMRGYIRSCAPSGGVMPFFEFRWAYFFNDAAFSSFLWDNHTAFSRFRAIFPAALSDPSNSDQWHALAVPMVYLARGTVAAQYRVPGSMGTLAGALPGCVTGMQPIKDDDPDCAMLQCAGGAV